MADQDKDERVTEGSEPEEQPQEPQADAEAVEKGAGEAEAAEPDTDDVDALKAQLETVRQEAADAREQALRAAAEAQNTRRRADKDVEQARKFGLERFAGDLLPVVDNLERALGAADVENEDMKPIIEGIELTHRSFLDVLGKHGIEQVYPHGEPFDPQFHEAMTTVPNSEVEPNTVTDVMQKGYTLNGRLLRPAMVVVSKPEE